MFDIDYSKVDNSIEAFLADEDLPSVPVGQSSYHLLMADHAFLNHLHVLFNSSDDDGINGGDLVDWVAEHLEATGRVPISQPESEAQQEARQARIEDQVEATTARYSEIVRDNGPEFVLAVATEPEDASMYGVFGEVVDVAAELGYDVSEDSDESLQFLDALAEATRELKAIFYAGILEKLK